MIRIISRTYGSLIDLQHFLFLQNGGQLPPIPYAQYIAKTGGICHIQMLNFSYHKGKVQTLFVTKLKSHGHQVI